MGGKRRETVPTLWLPEEVAPETHLQHLFTEIEHRWEEACGGRGGFGRVGGSGVGG